METPIKPQHFFRSQLVEVRSSGEIAATLDANGKLDGVPFMPEMARYCGTRVRVFRRANITCVEGHGLRVMKSTVFLQDLRCDGAFHDGCQRKCQFFWKEAWLKPAKEDSKSLSTVPTTDNETSRWTSQLPTRQADRYFCQSTELYESTSKLSRWNTINHFIEGIFHGELSIREFLQVVVRKVLTKFLRLREIRALVGTQEKQMKGDLKLHPGEWVDVKKTEEIQATLDLGSKNCGLAFVPSMSQYIGGRYQVEFPIKKIILEQTGKMIRLTNTVALKGVICKGACTNYCPRAEYLYWRENWLQRVDVEIADSENSIPNILESNLSSSLNERVAGNERSK